MLQLSPAKSVVGKRRAKVHACWRDSNGMIWDLLLPLFPQVRDRNGHPLRAQPGSEQCA